MTSPSMSNKLSTRHLILQARGGAPGSSIIQALNEEKLMRLVEELKEETQERNSDE